MSEVAYKGFSKNEMEFQYNPRESVPEFPELAKKRGEESRKARSTLKSWLNVPYGNSPREVMDIYPADRPGGPVLVYIHGGYWRSGSKDDNCNFAPIFAQRGATVVLVEYDLCPKVTVTDIVRQTRAAIAWVYRNILRYSANPSRLYVSGHSAGGHLTAMALAYDWDKEGLPKNLIKGAVATSGVYDLDMVMQISVNEQVRMTPEIAEANSPFVHPPLRKLSGDRRRRRRRTQRLAANVGRLFPALQKTKFGLPIPRRAGRQPLHHVRASHRRRQPADASDAEANGVVDRLTGSRRS